MDGRQMDGRQMRCNPGLAPTLHKMLPQEVLVLLDEARLRKMLSFMLDGIGSRVICFELMDKAVVDKINNRIEFRIREGESLWVTEEIVQHVLDLPTGSTKVLPTPEDPASADEEYANMTKALQYVVGKYSKPKEKKASKGSGKKTSQGSGKKASNYAKDIRGMFGIKNIELLFENCQKDDVKPYVNPKMLARLYLGVLIDRFLLPGTSAYVTSSTLRNVHDLDKLGDVDWAFLVHECLKKGCKKTNAPVLHGCVAVPMIVFVDCHKGNQLDVEKSGRINLYDEKMLNSHFNEPGRKGNQFSKKVKPLSSFELEKWEESPYKQFEVVLDNSEDDLDTLYKKRVVDRTRDEIVVDIGAYRISESTFVDCLKRRGKMHSDILHLVCDQWLADNVDKAVLSYGAVQFLLNKSETGGEELASAKVKDAKEIYAPIVSDGHISLVVVSHTELKIYFLDSWPDQHKNVADSLLANLQPCLQKHDIDISVYEKVTPKVKSQGNNCDCGFHVLLYVRGFDEKQIDNIDEEKVMQLRMELTKLLLYHSENRKNPKHRSVDEDIPDEDEECELIGTSDEARRNPNSSGRSPGESFVSESTEGTGQKDSDVDENSSEESLFGHHYPNDPSREIPAEGKVASKAEGRPVPKRKKGAGTSKAASKDSSEKTPIERTYKRRVVSADKISFEKHSFLSDESCSDIYEFIKAKDNSNDTLVFSVGQTSITAGELLKFLKEGNNDLRIINAFIHCLKYDDKGRGYSEQRIIIPAQDLNDGELVDVIKQELEELKTNALRFLLCPTVHNEECIVLFVDVKVPDQVTICKSSNSELTESNARPIGIAFAKHVKEAFGARSPISKIDDTLRVTQISFHADRKYSNLGSILALEHYNGIGCPKFLQSESHREKYRASKLAHLLIHQENSAHKFSEVTAIVDKDQVNIKNQKAKANRKRKGLLG